VARRKQAAEVESLRWPSAFASAEQAQLLVNHPAWKLLIQDLRRHHQEQSYRLVHEMPSTVEKMAEQNFERGRLAGWEWLLEFEEELREWQSQRK
jgi:hypothetical protein